MQTPLTTSQGTNPVRLVQIDALRGIAAMLVVLFHFTARFWEKFGYEDALLFNVEFGQYGVDFFFIISGFVIFLSLERLSTPSDYIRQRFWRIYPLFICAVFLEIVVAHYFYLPEIGPSLSTTEQLANFTLIHQFFYVPNINGVYWTLALELAFYFWALLLFKMVPEDLREMVFVVWVSTSVLLVTLSEALLQTEIPFRVQTIFMMNYSHLFAAGVVLFYSYKDKLTLFRVLMLLFFLAVHFQIHGWVAGVVASIAVVSVFLASQQKLVFLQWRLAIFMGTISYALYLVHQNIGHILMKKAFLAGYGQIEAMSVAVLISILLASLLTFYVERPIIRFVRKFRHSNVKNEPKLDQPRPV